jgi:hypothetical protein
VWGNLLRKSELEHLLVAACPFVSTWLCLAMQPAKLAIDPSQLIQSKSVRVSMNWDHTPSLQYAKFLRTLQVPCTQMPPKLFAVEAVEVFEAGVYLNLI